MKLSEVAVDVSESPEAIAAMLAEAGSPAQPNEEIGDDLVERVHEWARERRNRRVARDLVLRAFELARLTGHQEWRTMTTAVLKNRILDLTRREFDERAFGVATFREWVETYADILEVDETRRPPLLTLSGEAAAEIAAGVQGPPMPSVTKALPARWRIRGDLWHGMTDPREVGTWLWDGETATHYPADAVPDDVGPALPTLAAEDLRQVRQAFAAEQATSRADETLGRWTTELLPDSVLNSTVRGRWNAHLKDVVLNRIRRWFAEAGLELPHDLIQEPRAPDVDDDLQQLRQLAVECVRVMTRAELAEIRLSPAVVLRARHR